jgi:hypothetical protein
MQYFTRQLYVNDAEAVGDEAELDYAKEDYDVACKAYAERLGEIKDDLPKIVRKLLDDPHWMNAQALRYVDDHFYLIPAEELNFMLTDGEWVFILRYTIEEARRSRPRATRSVTPSTPRIWRSSRRSGTWMDRPSTTASSSAMGTS